MVFLNVLPVIAKAQGNKSNESLATLKLADGTAF